MKKSYSEGVANHTDPESCGCGSNGMAEALAGECMGQVLSREILIYQDADVVGWYGRQYRMYRNLEIHSDPMRSETLSTYGSIFRGNRENPTDMVITDIIMPEKEGIETIIDLRREFPEVKIIAMSGGGHGEAESYLHMAKGLGAMRTLTKPFGMEELMEAIGAFEYKSCNYG